MIKSALSCCCKFVLPIVIIGFAILLAYASRDPAAIDVSNITSDGGKYVILEDGRVLEYFVYGSNNLDAIVFVELAGFGTTGKMFTEFDAYYKEKNIKAIGISLPGFGYSTIHPGRRISEWHLDVDVVLKKEYVDKFVAVGCSFGTVHVMEMAVHYGPERVLALAIDRPLAPWREAGTHLKGEVPSFMLSKYVGDLFFYFIAGGWTFAADERVVRLKANNISYEYIQNDLDRSIKHTFVGWKENMITTLEDWGFSPKDIKQEKILVMYATDDELAPPAGAEWLIENFQHKPLVVKSSGYGHFTFVPTPHLLCDKILELLS